MEIISVINYKGGVGKTTVTSNLAAQLAWQGKRVLVIDMDAQASLTFSFISPEVWDKEYKQTKTIKTWFDYIVEGKEPPSLRELIIKPAETNGKVRNKGGCVDLICSDLGLINVDLDLAVLLGGANMSAVKKNYLKVHGKLRDAIASLRNGSEYDFVFIDCPPNFNIVTKNAIIASEKILIPAKPDYLSTLGIDYLLGSVKKLVKEFNEFASQDDGATKEVKPEHMGVVFTMISITSGQPIAAQRQFMTQTKSLGVPVFKCYFRDNKTIFADAPQKLVPVVLNYYSNGTHSEVVTEIERFVTEFEEKVCEEVKA